MQIFNVIKSFYGLFYAIHNSRFLQRLTAMWVTCFFLLSGEKLNKSKIASETSTLLGKSSKEKNVRQRKDYHNKRGTCWSRVYVYI